LIFVIAISTIPMETVSGSILTLTTGDDTRMTNFSKPFNLGYIFIFISRAVMNNSIPKILLKEKTPIFNNTEFCILYRKKY